MDRRSFLTTAGAVTATAALSAPGEVAAAVTGNDTRINALFERIFDEQVKEAPGLATVLGLDKGANARLRATFGPEPYPQARAKEIARTRRWRAQVQAISAASLSQAAQLNREIVLYGLEGNLVGPTRFDLDSLQSPYLISQQDGAYFSIPDFLNSQHPIETRADAEAYLSRLAEFGQILDFESAEQRRQAAKGRVAPAWSLELALGQMRKLRQPAAAESGLVRSIAERTRTKNIPGNWAARAAAIVQNSVYPALDRQMALVEQLKRTTQPGDGAQRMPNGDAIYAAALAEATTTTMTADEVHRLGLSQVAEYTGLLDALLRQAGYTQGTVGERLTALNKDPKQLYPETDAGRTQLIADLNQGVKAMTARLPQAFATLPSQPLEIRRVPVDIQDGASNGYYNSASLDGTRPAIYWINLKSVGDWPRYSLPALTYHEGVPGHHLQISLAQASTDIPMLRKISFFNSYVEGWALYSEQLAEEIGGYEGIEGAGYLQSFLFRSARLVVDTGLNHLGWSRERAVDYMTATTGFPRPRVQREVERYCVSIGQACSYKIGHLAWLRAREAAKAQLGARFDLKQFHEVLKDGAMPLTILERRVRERAAAQARA